MGLIDNIVSYYKMDTNGSIADSVGSRDLTITGATYTASGKINGGYDFDGSNDTINQSSFATQGVANAWTYNFWMNPDAADIANQQFLDLRQSSGLPNIIGIQGTTSNQMRIFLYSSSGSLCKDYKTTSVSMSVGNWYLWSFTRDGTNLKLYLDGTEITAITKSADAACTLTDTARKAYYASELGSGNRFDGTLDEIGVWSRALTSTEITELYNSGAGLQYPFSAAVVADDAIFFGMNF